MTTEQKEQIRHEQMLMNIPPDARDFLLRELEPRTRIRADSRHFLVLCSMGRF